MSEDSIIVRRSTREEALERVVNVPVNSYHGGKLRSWAGRELAVIRDGVGTPAPDPEIETEAFDTYGWPRVQEDILIEDNVTLFVKNIADAYKDARNYPEYCGITIMAEINGLGTASGSNSYRVRAGFGERVGLADRRVYKTEFVFQYQHDQQAGRFDKGGLVNGWLGDLSDSLKDKIDSEKDAIKVSGESLIIRPKASKE